MRTLPKYLTQDEIRRFFDAINSVRDRALFGVIYHYGLRADEATQLTIDDIDLKNHRIRIRRLKNGVGGEKPLWRHTAKLLRAYIRVRKDAGPYLFTGREGPLKKRMVQLLFADYAQKAGIAGRSVHALRHSIAVHLLEAGRGIEYVATTSATATSRTRRSMPRSPIPCASRCSGSSSSIPRSYVFLKMIKESYQRALSGQECTVPTAASLCSKGKTLQFVPK
jgi:integrase